ncbi:rhodanese-related sulfurtransferase [Rubidibacter lacunae KORDI 51-2]|uniref:Rhodanese-related sulfurtransferase n=1 Tax=Rubidibacter lacunae KORDI 51-2 TaxID=582515 RepID=U5DGJ3_9CHRO|nr:rhodanese-like domain-containing protein [Rubidibacter lacunae]ERN40407.1 rhodanese-related sulfurtransferase [Rubidibacter lacunae KORDI 51-2]
MSAGATAIAVEDFAELLATTACDSESVQLVDVREPHEVELAAIPGFTHLPLSQYEQWSGRIGQYLDPDRPTLVLCHHGIRSAQMCQWLRLQGFANVKNIIGGIDAYSARVDANVPRY